MPQATAVASLHSFGAAPSRTGPIIVAVGGREPEATLRAARVLARHSPNGVLAIAVLEPLPIYSLGEEPRLTPLNFETERRDALAARLSELVREHSQEPAAWRTDVSFGDPARAIAEVAEREKSPLIIMGIGRHHTVDRLLQRETVIRTLRVTRCPVLAVCGELAGEPRQVVAGTDFSPESACAAEVALTLMDAAGTISYVHAWQLSTLADPAFADVLAGIDERYERLLPARFERLHGAVATPPGITVRDITSRGDPAQELVHHAERLHADLIVVGRHGMGSLERLLVGSVASAVLRRATCSVLVAPAPRAAELERVQLRVSGTVEATSPEQWSAMLERFTARNRGRPTRLEVDDPEFGAQTQEVGYRFSGATYDPHDRRVELMLGERMGSSVHLSRGIPSPRAVALLADRHGQDVGLSIAHGRGQTLLTFTDATLETTAGAERTDR